MIDWEDVALYIRLVITIALYIDMYHVSTDCLLSLAAWAACGGWHFLV